MKNKLFIILSAASIAIFSLAFSAQAALVNKCSTISGGSTGSLGCSLGSVSSGNLIVVMVDGAISSSTATITDKGGNTYTAATVATSSLGMERTFYSANVVGGTSFNVTSTWGVASTTFSYISVMEFNNVLPISPLDATGTYSNTNQTAGNFNTASGTTSQAGDLLVAIGNCNDSSGVLTNGSGTILLATSSSQCDISEVSSTLGAAGLQSAPFHISNSSDKVLASMMAFKQADVVQNAAPLAHVTMANACTTTGYIIIQ